MLLQKWFHSIVLRKSSKRTLFRIFRMCVDDFYSISRILTSLTIVRQYKDIRYVQGKSFSSNHQLCIEVSSIYSLSLVRRQCLLLELYLKEKKNNNNNLIDSTKGQFISERNFCAFRSIRLKKDFERFESPKERTKFFMDFCPSL